MSTFFSTLSTVGMALMMSAFAFASIGIALFMTTVGVAITAMLLTVGWTIYIFLLRLGWDIVTLPFG